MGRNPGDRGIKKGGIHDPVARSIRNEQARDAMPTEEEQEEMKRDFPAEQGCKECGEDDPDVLNQKHPRTHNCRARQRQYGPVVLCDDCLEDRRSYREAVVQKSRVEGYDAVVFYECDYPKRRNFEHPTIERSRGKDIKDTRVEANATIQLKCRCGAAVDEIVYLDGDETKDRPDGT